MDARTESFKQRGAWWARISTPRWRETLGPYPDKRQALLGAELSIAIAHTEGSTFPIAISQGGAIIYENLPLRSDSSFTPTSQWEK